MYSIGRLAASALLAAAMGVAGCVEGTPGAQQNGSPALRSAAPAAAVARGKTAEERKLERDVRNLNQITRDIVISNTIQGAVAGAIAGCVLANLTDRDCKDGAIAGGIAGGIFGNQVGRQAAQAKREMVQLDATLAKLRGVSERLSRVETDLRAVVNRQNSEIASLRRQVNAGQVSASAAQARIAAINSNRQAVRDGLQSSRANVDREGAKLASLEHESAAGRTEVRRAVSNTSNRIARLRNSVRLVSTN